MKIKPIQASALKLQPKPETDPKAASVFWLATRMNLSLEKARQLLG